MNQEFSAAPRLIGLALFIGAIWAVYLLDPGTWAQQYGIVPREQANLIGIAALPFLHGSLGHIAANTAMIVANFGQRAFLEHWNFLSFIVWSSLLSAALIWLVHPDTGGVPVVGASALIFASVGHGLGISLDCGDWIGPLFIAAQVWLLWPLWQVMMIPGTGVVDLYGYAIDGTNVSVVAHWIGLGVGLFIAYWKGTTW